MGIDHQLYVGAYLELVNVPKAKRRSLIKKCISCGDLNGEAFCCKCGGRMDYYEMKYTPDLADIIGKKYEDILIQVYPDWCEDLKNVAYIDNGCSEYKPLKNVTWIDNHTPGRQRHSFVAAHRNMIDEIEKKGITCIIKFGVISYWS